VVRKASATLPLTPALSLGERENAPLPFSTTQRARSARRTSRTIEIAADCSIKRLGPFPNLLNFASPLAEPEVSQGDDETRQQPS